MSWLKSTVKGLGKGVRFMSGYDNIKKQASYLKGDYQSIREDVTSIKKTLAQQVKSKDSQVRDQWEQFVKIHRVSPVQLRRQYNGRRIQFYLLSLCLLFCLFVIFILEDVGTGTAGLCLFLIFSLTSSFRLYQIRHQNLCNLSYYFKAVRHSFIEFFPRSLPSHWDSTFDESLDVVKD